MDHDKPNSKTAGDTGFPITVNGNQLRERLGCEVERCRPRNNLRFHKPVVKLTISASDIKTAGKAEVTVFNRRPGEALPIPSPSPWLPLLLRGSTCRPGFDPYLCIPKPGKF